MHLPLGRGRLSLARWWDTMCWLHEQTCSSMFIWFCCIHTSINTSSSKSNTEQSFHLVSWQQTNRSTVKVFHWLVSRWNYYTVFIVHIHIFIKNFSLNTWQDCEKWLYDVVEEFIQCLLLGDPYDIFNCMFNKLDKKVARDCICSITCYLHSKMAHRDLHYETMKNICNICKQKV